MNLWVKRVALGLIAAVALFLFACLDEENILGFPNQNKKFKIAYIEIPIGSSVLLFDSLRTTNYAADPTKRLLVGNYTDPVFGVVEAEAYTQLVPSSTSRVKEEGAIFMSASLQLNFDLYHYGTEGTTNETYAVHELTEKLTYRNQNDYYSNRSVAYDPIPLGEASLDLSDKRLDSMVNKTDTAVTLTIPLPELYGATLFGIWNSTSDSFTDFEKFSANVKGLAIVGTNNQKVVGFSTGSNSKVILEYRTSTDTLTYNFFFANGVSSSKIAMDRSASALAGLTQPYQEFTPSNPSKLYIQSGAPVVTKLDFSKFLEFSDTIENLIINSAELSISDVDDPGTYDPPNSLFLQVLKNNNRLKLMDTVSTSVQAAQDTADLLMYANSAFTLTNGLQGISNIQVSKSGVFSVVGDNQQQLAQMFYDADDKDYSGFFSLFMQELAQKETNADGKEKTRFSNFVLYPGNPNAGKSVNRVSFNKSNMKLKIYYTIPTITE
jgi:hypothetical protein